MALVPGTHNQLSIMIDCDSSSASKQPRSCLSLCASAAARPFIHGSTLPVLLKHASTRVQQHRQHAWGQFHLNPDHLQIIMSVIERHAGRPPGH